MSDSVPSVAYALAYAKLGWPVVPCRGKRPCDVASHGYNSATCDHERIKDWWRRYHDANIGLATGHVFFALDVDGELGEESLMMLTDRFGNIPDTLTQFTGGGGAHMLFKPEPGLKNWAGRFCIDGKMVDVPGIDIRTSGSGIIGSPSMHESGRLYQWKDGHGPKALIDGKIEIASAPRWLIDIATPPPAPVVHFSDRTDARHADDNRIDIYVREALDGCNGAVRKIIAAPDGQQNFTLYQQAWAIGGFVGAGHIDWKTAFAALYAAGLQMPSFDLKRPWRAIEIEKTIRRGMTYGATRPRFLSASR